MSSISSTSRAAYTAHLQGTILPNLHGARDAIARIEADINEYEQVARRLAREQGNEGPRLAPVEIGAGVWGDALVKDTKTITLDLGLDIHLALPASEAAAYATKRAQVLRKKRDAIAKRVEKLQWEAEQFEGALQEKGE